MIKEILDDTKTVFGNETEVNYLLERNDDLVSFIAKNVNEWRKNHTLVLIDDDVLGVLFVQAHDYEITGIGVCEFYFDPLNEQVIKVRKTKNDMYIVEHVILGKNVYLEEPYQAYASSVNILMKVKEKTKMRG